MKVTAANPNLLKAAQEKTAAASVDLPSTSQPGSPLLSGTTGRLLAAASPALAGALIGGGGGAVLGTVRGKPLIGTGRGVFRGAATGLGMTAGGALGGALGGMAGSRTLGSLAGAGVGGLAGFLGSHAALGPATSASEDRLHKRLDKDKEFSAEQLQALKQLLNPEQEKSGSFSAGMRAGIAGPAAVASVLGGGALLGAAGGYAGGAMQAPKDRKDEGGIRGLATGTLSGLGAGVGALGGGARGIALGGLAGFGVDGILRLLQDTPTDSRRQLVLALAGAGLGGAAGATAGAYSGGRSGYDYAQKHLGKPSWQQKSDKREENL